MLKTAEAMYAAYKAAGFEEGTAAPPPNPKLTIRGKHFPTWHPKDQDDATLAALKTRLEWVHNTPSNKRWAPTDGEALTGAAIAGVPAALAIHAVTRSSGAALLAGGVGAVGGALALPAGRHIGQYLARRRVEREIERRKADSKG